MIALRPYQVAAHEAARKHWSAPDTTGALVVLPTGAGKTITALTLAVADYLDRGARVVYLATREELLNQPARVMAEHFPHHTAGIVQADRHTPDAAIVFASVATLATSPARLAEIMEHGRPALVICDEAHLSEAPTYRDTIAEIGAPHVLGLTATPDRADGADLSERWEIVHSVSIVDAIAGGWLVPPFAAVSRVPDLDLSRVSGRRDYDDAELGAELLRAGVVKHTVEQFSTAHTWHRLPGRDSAAMASLRGIPALVFTATVEQARLTAAALCADGHRARYIHGGTPTNERRRLLRAFSDGLIDVLCNAAVLTIGTDLPRVGAIVLARPTRSWGLFVQMVGRGLRLHPDKERCHVLDLAGATRDHSIVAAPVLIGGSRCPESPNGAHVFREVADDVRGKCEHCGRGIACYALQGAHEWGPNHLCVACGTPQCPGSGAGHHWIPAADHKRQCIDCGVEIPDPLGSLLKERRRRSDAVEADWIRLPGVTAPDGTGEAWVVDAGIGLLFVVGSREGAGAWRVWWLRKRRRTPQALSADPITSDLVRAYADDIVTRAERVAKAGSTWKRCRPTRKEIDRAARHGVWNQQGWSAGELASEVCKVHAADRGIAVGILARGVDARYTGPV